LKILAIDGIEGIFERNLMQLNETQFKLLHRQTIKNPKVHELSGNKFSIHRFDI
jgi:hypothetical protein